MEERILDLPDVPSPLPNNSYYEILVPDVSSATGYTSCKIKRQPVYMALLNQVGSGNTTSKIIETTVGSLTFVRDSIGYYKCDLTSLLTSLSITNDKVFYCITRNMFPGSVRINLRSDNVMEIMTTESGLLVDDLLVDTPIKIEFFI